MYWVDCLRSGDKHRASFCFMRKTFVFASYISFSALSSLLERYSPTRLMSVMIG